MLDIRSLLEIAIQKEASDLHLVVGTPPTLRIHGALVPLEEFGVLAPEHIKNIASGILNTVQQERFKKDWDLDFSLYLPDIGRFRVNMYMAQQNIGISFRIIPLKIKTLKELGLPDIIANFCHRQYGLILVTGPTGSGKTTTLAAMIDLINQERNCRIITIEDPIEYVYHPNKSMIIQREVYQDSKSFSSAVTQCLRQDPNVICVGEMRDLDTISTALRAAETGHLVLSTLHTPNTIETINRIIDVFPSHQHQQIVIQLASCLGAVIAQKLIPQKEGKSRVVATEILVANFAVKHLIRDRKMEQIASSLETGMSVGMNNMDSSILELYRTGVIDKKVALSELTQKENRQKLENFE